MEDEQIQAIDDSKQADGIVYRILEQRDIPDTVKLMTDHNIIIGGERRQSVYRAICQEALIDKRVLFVVGEEQSKIIAYHIVVSDRNRWRYSFMIRHPLIAIRNAFYRTFKQTIKAIKKTGHSKKDIVSPIPDLDEYLTPGATNRSWSDSSPQIGKNFYTGVAESHRGRRIIKGIFEYGDKILAARGVRRVDTVILSNNVKMIRATKRLGWNVYRTTDGSIFTTKDIDKDGRIITNKNIE